MRILLAENQIISIVVASICLLFLLGCFVIFFIDRKQAKKLNFNNDPTLNLDQSYTINLKSNVVKSFNLKTFRPLNTNNVEGFLNNFLPEWHDKIFTWLNDFVTKPIEETINGDRRVIVVDYIISRTKKGKILKTSKCIMLCTHVDLEHKTLSIDLEPFFNTQTKYNKKRLIPQFLYPVSSIKLSYENGKFDKGMFLCIDVNVKPNLPTIFNDTYIKSLLIDAIYKITSPQNTKIFFMGDYKRICLLEDKSMNTFDLNRRIGQIKNVIIDFLNIKGFDAYYDYYMVASLVKDLDKKFEPSYEKISKLFAIDQNLDRNFTIYQTNKNNYYKPEESYKQELQRIIRNSALDVTFRPIAHIANKRIVNSGYMSFVSPNNTLFKDISELRRIAKIYDADKDIFSLILRKIIPIFTSEKENTQQKLILEVTIDEITYAIRSLPHFSELDKSLIVLCFNSKELIDTESDDVFIRNLKNLKEKGYCLGLFTSKDDYVLKDKTYSLFDYFFFDAKFESNVKSNSMSFLKAHQFLEKLIKYKSAIIVCYNSTNLLGIDFLVKAGIEYFSADCISPRSPQLLPIDKKISKKLLNMNKQ